MQKKEISRRKRHNRIRRHILGTAMRPRLIVYRGLKNLSIQARDDTNNKVIFSLSTYDKLVRSKIASGGNLKAAQALAELFAQEAKAKGINEVIFDRAGYLFHGRVKVFADTLRKGGLKF